MKYGRITIFSMLSLFTSCFSNTHLGVNDITGSWKSSDQAKLIFNPDGTFEGIRLPTTLFLLEGSVQEGLAKGKTFDGSGNWEITTDNGGDLTLEINHVAGSECPGSYNPLMYSKTQIFEGDDLVYLFSFVGDPDDGRRYKFYKE